MRTPQSEFAHVYVGAGANRLPRRIVERLRLPLIVAPMFLVSGMALVHAACAAGAIGAFPAINARTPEVLEAWLSELDDAARDDPDRAPYCPNLIMKQPELHEFVSILQRHNVEMVITSVGAPTPVVGPLHDIGCLVLADVATIEHARRAVAARADGLVLLTAGAGGNTGWLNPFAFVRAVRAFYDGPVVLAGGISDAAALHAAVALGCDLAYMGTRFIATEESMASAEHKTSLVSCCADDVLTTKAFSGIAMNVLRPSLLAMGLDPQRLDEQVDPESAARMFSSRSGSPGPKRWKGIHSAGHSVSGVDSVIPAGRLVATLAAEYEQIAAHMHDQARHLTVTKGDAKPDR